MVFRSLLRCLLLMLFGMMMWLSWFSSALSTSSTRTCASSRWFWNGWNNVVVGFFCKIENGVFLICDVICVFVLFCSLVAATFSVYRVFDRSKCEFGGGYCCIMNCVLSDVYVCFMSVVLKLFWSLFVNVCNFFFSFFNAASRRRSSFNVETKFFCNFVWLLIVEVSVLFNVILSVLVGVLDWFVDNVVCMLCVDDEYFVWWI